jgi:ribonuclease P protein component
MPTRSFAVLPPDDRLRRNRDFRTAFARGRTFGNGAAVLTVYRRRPVDNEDTGRRIGFVVSKKQGKAVARNRIKRRLREAVRARIGNLRVGPVDLIFVGKSFVRKADWPEVVASVDELLTRAGLLDQPRKRSKETEKGEAR